MCAHNNNSTFTLPYIPAIKLGKIKCCNLSGLLKFTEPEILRKTNLLRQRGGPGSPFSYIPFRPKNLAPFRNHSTGAVAFWRETFKLMFTHVWVLIFYKGKKQNETKQKKRKLLT